LKISKKAYRRMTIILSALAVPLVLLLGYMGVITHQIDQRIEQLRSSQASSFYAVYPSFRKQQRLTESQLGEWLTDQGYVLKAKSLDTLIPGEYSLERQAGIVKVHIFRPEFQAAGHGLPQTRATLVLSPDGSKLRIDTIYAEDGQPIEKFENPPKKVANYFAGRVRTQDAVHLSEIPVSARHAVMAIEDVRFLEHSGVSLRGTFRALYRDLLAGGFVEGGSTITQQLMKNLFFSNEKALSRKIKEAIFAVVTEARHSKEAILEAYLNEVYMGQWGTHEIHGVAEGARYYFHRPISKLSLSQSATLAAIVQAPNAQDPRRHPDRTLKRRNLVLKKMLDAEFILPEEYEMAIAEPLGVSSSDLTLPDVDYFVDLVLQQLPSGVRSRLDSDILSVYVTLNPMLQAAASRALSDQLKKLVASYADLKKLEDKGVRLQGALLAIDVKNCTVLALQGGRNYLQTQFNRVTQGRRQAGSLFKPFVYLTAFQKLPDFTPQTVLEDSPFEWKYEGGQTWSPKNYDDDFRGPVSARTALEGSINVPTARLAEKVGVPALYDTLTTVGMPKTIPKVPSLTLGSADVSPLEVAQSYTTMARLGNSCKISPIETVFDGNGNEIFRAQAEPGQVIDPIPVFKTVSMMQGALTHGTARSAKYSGLDVSHFAGKTGTTNESRDTWFVGFSPEMLALVWVGYDEKEKVGLTGSSAALPAWIQFAKEADPFTQSENWQPPEGVKSFTVDHEDPTNSGKCKDPITEYLSEGQKPPAECDND
jgi:penicillin-binding protein 1B